MIENLKKLVSEMHVKSDFVQEVTFYYGTSYKATYQNWFQGVWGIPEDKQPKVIEMAQNFLFKQNQRERQVLRETGYKFKEVV